MALPGLWSLGDHPPSAYGHHHNHCKHPRPDFCKPELAKRVYCRVSVARACAREHVIAGKAVMAEGSLHGRSSEYIHAVCVRNRKAMCDEFISMGWASGHQRHGQSPVPADPTDTGLTGKAVQDELDRHGITLNKNCVPNESAPPADLRRPHSGRQPCDHQRAGYTGRISSSPWPAFRKLTTSIRDMQMEGVMKRVFKSTGN